MARTAAEWRDVFDQFVASKVQRASAATLDPFVTLFDAPAPGMSIVRSAWSTRLFGGPFYMSEAPDSTRPACSLVFVQSSDGNTVMPDPEALGGGNTDKHVIYEGLSRVAADAVLAGAETVRGSDLVFSVWHPEMVALRASLGLPRHPSQIVVTRRGVDVEDLLLFNVPEIPSVLVTETTGAQAMGDALHRRPWIRAIVAEIPRELPSALACLASLGIARVSCVGGRTLAGSLLDARLIDDVYLTTAARPGGEPGTPLHDRPLQRTVIVSKRGTGADAGVMFEHWVSVGSGS
jgi:riboflavin biosynthesis pyrimidine reductase